MRRMSATLALAATILLTATGCSVVTGAGTAAGIVFDDAASELIVQRLQATLEELPGVDDSAVDFDAFGKTGREASARISAPTATAVQLDSIAQAVREAFHNPDLGVAEPVATITGRDGSTLTLAAFAMQRGDLAADVTYWSNLRDILDTTLDMEMREFSGGYSRIIAQSATPAVTAMTLRDDWPAVMALSDPSTAEKSWSLQPGLQISGSLPDRAAIDLLANVAQLGPAGDGTLSFALSITNTGTPEIAVTVTIAPVSIGGIASSRDWPRVAAAASAAIASAIPVSQIGYFADVDGAPASQGFVFIGPCATPSSVDESDAAFFRALVISGVALPAGSGPGRCGH